MTIDGWIVLGKVGSPGFQHIAGMLSCVEPSRLRLWPTVVGILDTLVDTYQSRALLLVRVESAIPPHTAVLLGSVESRCPRRVFCRRGCEVLV